VGGASTYQICLRPSADRSVLRSRSPQGYGANGLRQLPFAEFPKRRRKPKTSFPFLFRFAAEGSGEEARRKCKEVFGFARASPRARLGRLSARAERKKRSKPPRARRVRSVAPRLEIGSSGAVYSHNANAERCRKAAFCVVTPRSVWGTLHRRIEGRSDVLPAGKTARRGRGNP
jgi:hypothetical protein